MSTLAKVETPRRFHWFALVVAEYSICNLGHFAVMAIFSLFLVDSLNLPAAQAGGLMLFSSLSFCLSRIFLAPLIDRLPTRQATFLALILTGLGYLGMSVARTPLLLMLLLLAIGRRNYTNTPQSRYQKWREKS